MKGIHLPRLFLIALPAMACASPGGGYGVPSEATPVLMRVKVIKVDDRVNSCDKTISVELNGELFAFDGRYMRSLPKPGDIIPLWFEQNARCNLQDIGVDFSCIYFVSSCGGHWKSCGGVWTQLQDL